MNLWVQFKTSAPNIGLFMTGLIFLGAGFAAHFKWQAQHPPPLVTIEAFERTKNDNQPESLSVRHEDEEEAGVLTADDCCDEDNTQGQLLAYHPSWMNQGRPRVESMHRLRAHLSKVSGNFRKPQSTQ